MILIFCETVNIWQQKKEMLKTPSSYNGKPSPSEVIAVFS